MKEFQHTLKIVHDVCQTVTKVPEDTIQKVREDNFVEDGPMKVNDSHKHKSFRKTNQLFKNVRNCSLKFIKILKKF